MDIWDQLMKLIGSGSGAAAGTEAYGPPVPGQPEAYGPPSSAAPGASPAMGAGLGKSLQGISGGIAGLAKNFAAPAGPAAPMPAPAPVHHGQAINLLDLVFGENKRKNQFGDQ